MKIALVQIQSIKGDIAANITNHKEWIAQAILNGADMVVFPELSITGYEPRLAKDLATDKDDPRFEDFQRISNATYTTICIGVPLKYKTGITISMIIFQPGESRLVYSKKYLHPDEVPFFIPGENNIPLIGEEKNIAFSICYELMVPEHAEDAAKNSAAIYIVSAAKTKDGVEKAFKRLADIATGYSMTILMSDSIGPSDDFIAAGRSAVWNNKGALLEQLSKDGEGMIVYETLTNEVIKK